MRRFFHSLRWRVQAWHALILLLAVGVLWLTAYRLAWDNQWRRLDKELADKERQLVRGLLESTRTEEQSAEAATGKEPLPSSPAEFIERLRAATLPEETRRLFQGGEPGHAYFSLRDQEGRVLQESANVPADALILPTTEQDLVEEWRTIGRRREFSRSSNLGLRGVVGREITPEIEDMRHYGLLLSLFCGGIWIVGLAGGWWLAGHAIRPIERISRTATRIAEGNLQERIDTGGTENELDQLGHVLNRTFERLHAAFERQRQFTADASHELRTPVAILLSETQRILKREHRDEEEYRNALQTCRATAERMRRLIESLLLLARQDAGERPAPTGSADLAIVLDATATQLIPLVEAKDLTLHRDLHSARCAVPADTLSILATNLLMNAIQHHDQPGGRIDIRCAQEDSAATFEVRDDGPGIAAEDLPHIFERFYRADKARTGGDTHAGLGLAVAKMIVEEHAGTLTAHSTGRGAVFTVRFPA